MATAAEAMAKLDGLSVELGQRSTDLADVERRLEPVEDEYRAFVDNYEVGLWTRSQDEESFRLPSAAMRLKLAERAMDPELLGRYVGYINSRKRLQQRIRDLKAQVEAQRSILSALKVEMEATGHR